MMNVDNLNIASQALPVARVGAYVGAAFLVGRKVAQGLTAATFAAGSKVAGYLDHSPLATKLAGKSDLYLTAAKKNLARDLAVATALIATGFGAEKAENFVDEELVNSRNFSANTLSYMADTAANIAYKVAGGFNSVFGRDNYPSENLNNAFLSTKNSLVKNFRISPPYQTPIISAKDFWAPVKATGFVFSTISSGALSACSTIGSAISSGALPYFPREAQLGVALAADPEVI